MQLVKTEMISGPDHFTYISCSGKKIQNQQIPFQHLQNNKFLFGCKMFFFKNKKDLSYILEKEVKEIFKNADKNVLKLLKHFGMI